MPPPSCWTTNNDTTCAVTPRACVLHRFPAWAFSGTFQWIYRDRLGGSDCRCVAVLSSNAAGDQSRARCRSACCLSGIPVPCGRAAVCAVQWLRARVMSGIILGESEFRHTGSGKSKNPSHRAGSPRGTKQPGFTEQALSGFYRVKAHIRLVIFLNSCIHRQEFIKSMQGRRIYENPKEVISGLFNYTKIFVI